MPVTKKKILLFTDWYEPGYKAGGPIQSCRNFVMAMQKDFDLFIVTSAFDFNESEPYTGIATDKWLSSQNNVHVFYAEKKHITFTLLKEFMSHIQPDYIYLNSMYSYRYAILPLLFKTFNSSTANMVIAPRGMLQSGAMKFKAVKKKLFLKFLDIISISRKLTFHATDEQERKDILRYFPNASRINVISNFPATEITQWKQISKQPDSLKCIYISRIAQKKNLLFLLQVLQQLPHSTKLSFTVRGEIEDGNYWKKCLSVIKALPPNISVSFEGSIPNHEVIEVLQQHHLFVLPTFGENFGHAIFESFLAGKPALISDCTPWRNLSEKKIGWDLPLDSHAVFCHALEQAAGFGQQEYDEWSHNAWKYAQDYNARLNLKEDYLKLFS